MNDDEWARSVARAQSMHAGSILAREVDRLRAELAAIRVAPKHLLVGDRVEAADGARATVTGSAPRGPRGEPAVNLDWDGDAGGPAYEHDLRRVVGAGPAVGRDLGPT